MTAGYSGTPLVKKLGIKPGFRAAILNPPENYSRTLGALPENVLFLDPPQPPLDFIQFFIKECATLEAQFPHLKSLLAKTGMLWISWPKKSSKIPSDLDENIIRETGLQNGLVDVKVCAVDENWSGLKFVYRLKDR